MKFIPWGRSREQNVTYVDDKGPYYTNRQRRRAQARSAKIGVAMTDEGPKIYQRPRLRGAGWTRTMKKGRGQ